MGDRWTRAEALLRRPDVRLRRDYPLGRHTTLGVGGPAALVVWPRTVDALTGVLEALALQALPFRILGAGSNLLVAEEPLDYAVVGLREIDDVPRWDETGVEGHAGLSLPALARQAAERGLAGLEWGIGIPGSLGGAVRMNAGACGVELGDQLQWAEWVTVRRGEIRFERGRPKLMYRGSELGPGDVILRLRLALTQGTREELLAEQAEHLERRRATQPTASRSAGCMFKNPAGDAAGRLIDVCGLKGLQVGGAEVSTLHGNFVLNRGGATASDVRRLVDTVRARVAAQAEVVLEEEIVYWPAEAPVDPA